MKKLLVIAHEFHQKTRSHDFLVRLLEPHYEVVQTFLAPGATREDGSLAAFSGHEYAVVLCWQILPSRRALARIRCDHLVFFPMFDHSGRWGIEQWMPCRHMRIFSFSATMAWELRRWGFAAHPFQFFPDPGEPLPPGDLGKAFFWNRTERINLRTVSRLLSGTNIHALHVHKVLDPGQSFIPIPPDAGSRFNIEYSDWFESRQLMSRKIAECALYFAPRTYEGIGMAFLEAMAMGRCVIAPDHPTMNEYITHGVTGFLYHPKRPRPLVLGDIARIQRQTRDYMVAGYQRWQAEREGIVSLLESPVPTRNWKPWIHLALRCLTHPFRASQRVRQRLFSIRIGRKEWRVRFFGLTWGPRPEKPE
jgi:hypothetical protein